MALHDGHRQRMYLKAEKGALEEHEWLELLLFSAIPRRNTNEIAHQLIRAFGSAINVFEASFEDLKKVPGVGNSVAAHIQAIGYFYKNYREKYEPKYLKAFSSHEFLPYVKETYKNEFYEVVDIYLLEGSGHIMKKQRFSMDSICKVEVLPEEVASFLLEKDAVGAVMVHNHPFGEAVPSGADDEMTKKCQLICSLNNRLLCDHIIYAPSGIYSYYLSGRMREISEKFCVNKVFGSEKK